MNRVSYYVDAYENKKERMRTDMIEHLTENGWVVNQKWTKFLYERVVDGQRVLCDFDTAVFIQRRIEHGEEGGSNPFWKG